MLDGGVNPSFLPLAVFGGFAIVFLQKIYRH